VNTRSVNAEYLFIGGHGELRSKGRMLDMPDGVNLITGPVEVPGWVPSWISDGSSSWQAHGNASDLILKPVRVFPDSLSVGERAILVLCETYRPTGEPHETNYRARLVPLVARVQEHEPWFGPEQEYTLLRPDGNPLAWKTDGTPPSESQGTYYCSVGASRAFGRSIMQRHRSACLSAGLAYYGYNLEVMPGQAEFQMKPLPPLEFADQLVVARYLLERVAELEGVDVSFAPKPVKEGDWNGAGCHTNFSTKAMREMGGIDAIQAAIRKLEIRHGIHIEEYEGPSGDNKSRLSGKFETCSIDVFKAGVGDRGASVRINVDVEKNARGYFEDRRPPADCDPYKVARIMLETICL